MSRVKRGVTARARHKKVLAMAKGYRGRSKNVFRVAVDLLPCVMELAAVYGVRRISRNFTGRYARNLVVVHVERTVHIRFALNIQIAADIDVAAKVRFTRHVQSSANAYVSRHIQVMIHRLRISVMGRRIFRTAARPSVRSAVRIAVGCRNAAVFGQRRNRRKVVSTQRRKRIDCAHIHVTESAEGADVGTGERRKGIVRRFQCCNTIINSLNCTI